MGRPTELTEEERHVLSAQGLKPFEIWLPDFADPAVLASARAEAKRIALADQEEDISDWMEAIQKDMWEGEDQI